MARAERFEDIKAWQKARELVKSIYRVSAAGRFARDFVLRDQIRLGIAGEQVQMTLDFGLWTLDWQC
jgi:hypothetical protein